MGINATSANYLAQLSTDELLEHARRLENENAYLRGQIDGMLRNMDYFRKNENQHRNNGPEVARCMP